MYMNIESKPNVLIVDGVVYERSKLFGNRKRVRMHKNKKRYSRKNKNLLIHEEISNN